MATTLIEFVFLLLFFLRYFLSDSIDRRWKTRERKGVASASFDFKLAALVFFFVWFCFVVWFLSFSVPKKNRKEEREKR